MLKSLLNTTEDYGAFVTRLTLGVVFFPHGAQKLLGWYGGSGFTGTVEFFGSMGIPSFLGALIILAEFFGAIALILGVFGRPFAAFIVVLMLGAIFTTHLPNGFFMNWFGNQAGEGFEYHLLAIGMAVAVLLKGSGALSLDRVLAGPKAA